MKVVMLKWQRTSDKKSLRSTGVSIECVFYNTNTINRHEANQFNFLTLLVGISSVNKDILYLYN